MASLSDSKAGPSEERISCISTDGTYPPHTICQLCSKPYRDPRILPCLHSFCAQCLHNELERSGAKQNMECPTCQRSITVPEGGVNAVPQNLHLGFEVKVAGYLSKIGSDGEKSCDACIDGGKVPAVVFCCTCGQLLCTICQENHKGSKLFYCHQMVGLDKESLRLLPSIMTPTEHLCSKPHHLKELKSYCETCQCLACIDCTLVLHKDHRIAETCNTAKVYRDGMREALVCAKEVTSKLSHTIDTSDKMAGQVETFRENSTLLINKAFEQLHQSIEKQKKGLFLKMEALSVSKTTALTLQKKQLLKMQDEIGRYTEVIFHILQTHTDHEVIALGGLLPTEIKATLKKVGNVPLIDSISMEVSLPTDSLMSSVAAFGNVIDLCPAPSPYPSQSTWSSESVAKVREGYCVKLETKTSKGKRYPCGGQHVKAELRPISNDGAVVPGEVEDHEDGTYTITLIPKIAGPHMMIITMDGQLVQNSPHNLDVNLISCKLQHNFGFKDPSGIAIDHSGDIYIANSSDGHIHVFDQACHEKKTIGSGGSGDGQFRGSFSLSIKGDVIYVADDGNNRIQKLTTEGQFLQKFEKFGHKGRDHFSQPKSVIVDCRDRMIVADHNNNRVVMLDQNGSWLLTINGRVSGKQGYNYIYDDPWGLALDSKGDIHVVAHDSKSGSGTIRVFTPEGTYVRSYGDVNNRSGIVIFEGYSFVCGGYRSYSFSIIDPHGNEVLKVGNLPYTPFGLILDPNGDSLYVIGPYNVWKYSVLW